MDGFLNVSHSLLMFVIVLTVLVFIHEWGHYIIARINGVRVEVFSIGFGPEIIGWTAQSGTRWKISWIPLGGYVKFFGDTDAASRPDANVPNMSEKDRAESFHHKRLGQRAAIVAAGPIANFILAILILAGFYMAYGKPVTPAIVGTVVEGSAAEEAGFLPDDRIIDVDGRKIEYFSDLQQLISMNTGDQLKVVVERAGQQIELHPTPQVIVETDRFGNEYRVGRLGISRAAGDYEKLSLPGAVVAATSQTGVIVDMTFKFIGQIISGRRSTEDMGGPLRIAKMSGETAQDGIASLVWFMAMLSINLGLINLFPVPMLDGGHLMYYGIEAVLGRPMSGRLQEYGFRIGLALVLCLMVLVTWNDLNYLKIFDF